MRDEGAERREYVRAFFDLTDGYALRVSFVDGSAKPFIARMVNLSMGGIGLAVAKFHNPPLRDRAILAVDEVQGSREVPPLASQQMEVRWIVDTAVFEYATFGCKFIDPSESLQQQIQAFIQDSAQDVDPRPRQ